LRDDVDRLTVVPDGEQLRRGRVVPVPDVVMHHLEVPDPFSGSGIQREQAVAEQVGARAIAAVEVVLRTRGRHVDDAAGAIDRHLRPVVRAADALPRIFRPRVVAELPFVRDRVEGPDEASGADVEGTDIAGRRLVLLVRRRSEDDQVLEHATGRCRLH